MLGGEGAPEAQEGGEGGGKVGSSKDGVIRKPKVASRRVGTGEDAWKYLAATAGSRTWGGGRWDWGEVAIYSYI